MFTKYTKTGRSKSSGVKDIRILAFNEIQENYLEHFNNAKELYLEELNQAGMAAWKRKKVIARVAMFANSEESDEGGDYEDTSDYTPIEEVGAAELEKMRDAANDYAVLKFAEDNSVKESWDWLGPQLIAHLGTYRLPDRIDGKIDAHKFLDLNVARDNRELGIYRFITKVARGKLMEKQVLPVHTPYCSLVPLYMAAQKKFNEIKYTEWSVNNLKAIVDKDLYAAMTCDPPMGEVNDEELLKIRTVGLSYISKSAKERGQTKHYNPETYHALSGIGDSAIGNLPKYAKAMLCQIWCAHPMNRNKYMILDPYNWDRTPPPLISSVISAHRQVPSANAGTIYRSTDDSLPAWE